MREAEILAVIVVRDGALPAGADEVVARAHGRALLVGSGTERAAAELTGAREVRHCDTGAAVGHGTLARALAPVVDTAALILMPASPDGRDLAPRLAAELGRPLLAQAISVVRTTDGVHAELSRLDDRLLVPVTVHGGAVVTLVSGTGTVAAVPFDDAEAGPVVGSAPQPTRIELPVSTTATAPEAELIEVLEPDPETMDLADAQRVLGAGAGLVPPGTDDATALTLIDLLTRVGGRLGASTGATRVVTDAGWAGHDRQIGTTGVAIDPDLYIAFGVSGASQHTGGLGSPRHIVSVNRDPSCPMTAMADLGLVTDARELLLELARRLGVELTGGLGVETRKQEVVHD